MTKKEFITLDDSIESFELIKKLSEEKWKNIEHLSSECGGKRIKGLKWKKGLTKLEIISFENQLGYKFPQALKNFYKVMNGLAIVNENFSEDEEYPFYQDLYRSFPEDIETIKRNANLEFESYNVSIDDINSKKAPIIFNYCGNRYLILDESKQVLSIRGDSIFFGLNLSKGLSKDIFNNFMDTKVEDLLKYKWW
ncbi:SMI1/KNR4 family protein [Psychroserpens sp. NJDZ02]|uniref:SMI1/KNR4 family protein n=1 Tax=Psychroserpens sp. NJDZ02 TaxID=2570561 RepID=UPI0010A93038|nr:SMI1/KNR4 family protein [Psychroserpens sp. NJDZ02]QCE40218.1 SMI1/KNR4 family protein [Psychroserpens sp. NJDZ02]